MLRVRRHGHFVATGYDKFKLPCVAHAYKVRRSIPYAAETLSTLHFGTVDYSNLRVRITKYKREER